MAEECCRGAPSYPIQPMVRMLILGIVQCLHRIRGKILHSSAGEPIFARKLAIHFG